MVTYSFKLLLPRIVMIWQLRCDVYFGFLNRCNQFYWFIYWFTTKSLL